MTTGTVAQITVAWSTAKGHLSTFQANVTKLIDDLESLEGDKNALENSGAPEVADWLRIQIAEARAALGRLTNVARDLTASTVLVSPKI